MDIKKILVIRFRRVGDSVLAMALCHNLKTRFPEAEVHFVINEGIAALYQNHPDIDKLITFSDEENKKPLKYLSKIWKVMRNTKYDVIIDMRSTVRTLFFSLFSLSTPYRIGTKKKYNMLLHNYRIDNHADRSKNMVESNLMLMKPLEKICKLSYDETFRLYVDKTERASFRLYMEQQGIDFNRPVVLATVTARLIHKVWDKDRMKEILKRIIEKYDAQIIFNFGGQIEEEFAIEIHREMENDKHIFTNVKANTLRDLSALISNCDFFFGNEGGPRHMAQALDIPSYAIYPPGISKEIWLPGDRNRYDGISPNDILTSEQQGKDYMEKFDLITVDAVWERLNKMMTTYLHK